MEKLSDVTPFGMQFLVDMPINLCIRIIQRHISFKMAACDDLEYYGGVRGKID